MFRKTLSPRENVVLLKDGGSLVWQPVLLGLTLACTPPTQLLAYITVMCELLVRGAIVTAMYI